MIHKYELGNGIPVFVVESHASPVVSIHAVVTRGSIHEPSHLAGISHFLEHSLFKGTRRRRVGQIALEIETHGGEINAFTSFEETAYYTTLASRYFKEGLDVIADAICSPGFDTTEMEKEKEVILEEIKRTNDSPHKTLSMNLWKAAFHGTPYGRPVLGFESTVAKINAAKLRRYFERHYHAGTISLFVVGDIDRVVVQSEATKQLSKIARRKTPPLSPFRFSKIRSAQLTAISKEIEETYVQIGIPCGGVRDLATAELDLMASALGQGESSRLYQRLVKETQVALDTSMGLVATSHCGLVVISLTVAPEKLENAVSETYRLLSEVAQHGLTDDEIDRIKSSLEADTIYSKETVEGYARRLGYYYCEFGTPDHEATYLDELLSVSPREATNAISSIFQKAPLLSIVHPKDHPAEAKRILSHAQFTSVKHLKESVPVLTRELKDGVTFISKRNVNLPTLSLRFFFQSGSKDEPQDKAGIGTLFSRVWNSGTKSYTSLEIAKRLEALGASLSTYCGRYTVGTSLECLTKHWNSVLPILEEILTVPTFPTQEFETEKHLLVREILAEKDSPAAMAHLGLMERMFPNHAYGRSALGRRETVEKLTREDLVHYYHGAIHRHQLIVTTVGDFRKLVFADLEALCTKIPQRDRPKPRLIPLVGPREVSSVRFVKSPLFQSHLIVGFVTGTLFDPDRYALKILSSALSGQGGRLFLELRDRQSLAYSVSPMQNDGPEAGMFSFYIGCSPEKWARALQGIRREIDRVILKPFPKNELSRAKQYWLGRFELDGQRNSSQCFSFGLDEVYGLGYDHSLGMSERIQSITARQIQEVAEKYLNPEFATISIVHPQELAPHEVLDAWGVSRKQIHQPSLALGAV